MTTNRDWENISGKISQKIDLLRSAGNLTSWKSITTPPARIPSPAHLTQVPDNEWVDTPMPFTWSSKDGEKWFITSPKVPAVIHNIQTSGSEIYFDFLMTIGATIYLNGEHAFHEDYWTDTRAVQLQFFTDFDHAKPFEIAIRTNASDGFGYFGGAYLRISAVDNVIFDLDLLLAQLKFTHFLAAKQGSDTLSEVWKKAANALNLSALAEDDWSAWNSSVEIARGLLAPFAEIAKTYTGNLIAHSHIDMNWLWPWKETVEVCRRDFTTMDKLMQKYEEFKFSQSQASTYYAMQTYYPEIFKMIQARIAEGRWDVTANTWVEGDLNTAAGEILIRQIMITRDYIQKTFGVESKLCWEPDTFGHPAMYPQILQKSGIQYYYFCRAGKRHPLFWWEAPDGSRVFAVQDLMGYGGEMIPSRVVEGLLNFYQKYDLKQGLYVYGVGDHGGAATARDIEIARKMRDSQLLPNTIPSKTSEFYDHAIIHAANVPVVQDELNTVFEGCYTSHADIKRLNRQSENSLLNAEAAVALASLLAGAPAPDLTDSWRNVCFHQFHDILCGCAIGVTYDEANEKLSQTLTTLKKTNQDALEAIASSLDTSTGSSKQLVVFNPLGWKRDDVVRIPKEAFANTVIPAAFIDEDGKEYPAQLVGDEVLFIAKDIPAFGTRLYQLSTQLKSQPDGIKYDKASNSLDNDLVRIEVDRNSGALRQLLDHETGRDIGKSYLGWGPEAKVNAGVVNRLQILWEQPHPMSAWNIGDITRMDNLITGADVKLVEVGPVCGVIEVRRKFLNSSLVQRIWVYRGLKRIDFQTLVDWHEKGSSSQDAPMLRATFTPLLGKTRATYETAFAGIERPADGLEKPALRWMDLSEESGDYGLSLLNDCKYGHSASGNTMGLTLVRASYEPDNNPDEGLHPFTYSLYPHRGSWKEAGTIQRAAELNQPLQFTFTSQHAGCQKSNQATVQCESDHVLISAIKLAEKQPSNGKALIVRLYETYGKAGNALLKFAWKIKQAEEVNLIEKPIQDIPLRDSQPIFLKISPYEIKTVRLIVD